MFEEMLARIAVIVAIVHDGSQSFRDLGSLFRSKISGRVSFPSSRSAPAALPNTVGVGREVKKIVRELKSDAEIHSVFPQAIAAFVSRTGEDRADLAAGRK